MPKKNELATSRGAQVANYQPSGDFIAKMNAKASEDVKKEAISDFRFVSGIKDGTFQIGDIELGESITGVIMGISYINAYYSSQYNPKSPEPPECFAVSLDEDELEAHDTVPSPVNLAKGKDKGKWEGSPCHSCPHNQFADDGSGKACKNQRKLAFLPLDTEFEGVTDKAKATLIKKGEVIKVDNTEFPEVGCRETLLEDDAEIFMINVSTTSLKHVKRYIADCKKYHGYPYDGVFCKITLIESANGNYFEFKFEPIDVITEFEYEVIESMRETANRGLTQPIPMEKKEKATATKKAVTKKRTTRQRK